MNAHSRVLRKALQLFLFVGMLLGLALLRPTPVAHAVNTTSDCFALSNEPSGDLISKLNVAGFGSYNLYQALVAIQANTDPSISGIMTDQFLHTLQSCPLSSGTFTTQLKNVDTPGNTVEACTDGTVQTVPVSGFSSAAQGFPMLVAHISGVADANFTHTTGTSGYIATWDKTSGGVTTTYRVFGVG